MERADIMTVILSALEEVFPTSAEVVEAASGTHSPEPTFIDMGVNSIDVAYIVDVAMEELNVKGPAGGFFSAAKISDLREMFYCSIHRGDGGPVKS